MEQLTQAAVYAILYGLAEYPGRHWAAGSEGVKIRQELLPDILEETKLSLGIDGIDVLWRQDYQRLGESDDFERPRELIWSDRQPGFANSLPW